MKYVSLPPITDKQKEIPPLIFRFRYITRPQFQKLTNEPYQPNMNTKLKQLVNKKYLKILYQKKQKTLYTPAKYCMGNMGIQYLKSLDYDEKSLKKYYEDDNRSEEFMEKCLFIVDVYLSLFNESKKSLSTFEFYTQSEFIPEGPMKELSPDFGYVYERKNKVVSYACEIFDQLMSDGAIRYRIRRYFEFLSDEEVEFNVIFICPTNHIYKVVIKKTNRLLEEELTGENIHFTVTTIERMRTGEIGEKIGI